MKPIIKWTGGKYSEFKKFSDIIPEFNRYIEPFFGSGGVFFSLEPDVPSFINDKCDDLISFYRLLLNEDFKNKLEKYSDFWGVIGNISKQKFPTINSYYSDFKNETIDKSEFKTKINNFVDKEVYNLIDFNSNKDFFINDSMVEILKSCLNDKLNRIKRIENKENKNFTDSEMIDHVETAFKSAFYTHFRNILNQNKDKKGTISEAQRVANWYIIREFCYGSMFRFNRDGEFNIPYGGIAYNKKDLKQKIKKLFSEDCRKLFLKTSIYNLDFEDFIKEIKPTKDDFMFVDPPYDTTFKKYDNDNFDKESHKRLSETLFSLDCKWLLIIKNTDFILNLYKNPNVNIDSYEKKYIYNARGRNDRDVEHLIIKNY